MPVLREFRREQRPRRTLSLMALGFAAVVALWSPGVWAQEEAVVDEAAAAAAAGDLWTEVVQRYEVVVLSRGLLLEPLDENVELLTIEIIDDSVAIDGESVGDALLRERVGDEHADLVLELAGMDPAERRVLFEGEDAGMEVLTATAETEAEATTAKEERRDRRRHRESQVAVGNSLTIHEDEVANDALVFGGPLYVRGKVAGDAVAVGGSVTVSGEVTGDVAAVVGNLTIEANAEIEGDVVSVGGHVEIDDEANVRGQIIEVPFGPNLRFGDWPGAIFGGRHGWRSGDELFEFSPWGVATSFMWEAFKIVVIALLACLVMLVAREPLERVKRRAASEPWLSGLVGLGVWIFFLPLLVVVIVILCISIIGIPLLLLVPFFVLALIMVAFLGYSSVALGIGQFLRDRFGWKIGNPYLVLLLGVLTLQVWSIIGDSLDVGWGPLWFFAVMFGLFGLVIKFIAWTVGLGAAVLSRFGTADGWGGTAAAVSPPTPPMTAPNLPEPEDPQVTSAMQDLGFASEEPSVPSYEPPDIEEKPPSPADDS